MPETAPGVTASTHATDVLPVTPDGQRRRRDRRLTAEHVDRAR